MTADTTNPKDEEAVVADEPSPVAEAPEEKSEVETPETPAEVPAEPKEEETPEEAPAEAPEEISEEKPPSRREQLRVQQLLERYGDPRPPTSQPKRPDALNYDTAIDADPEVIKQLEADRQAYSDLAYQQGLQQSEVRSWKTSLKMEAPQVEKEYPFLNPNDKDFHPAASDAMSRKYLRFVGYDQGDAQNGVPETIQQPDLSYADFVASEMEFVDELASQKISDTTRNIAKQAATTGLRPDGSSAKRLNLNREPKEMTMEELYASIGQKQPK